MLSPDAVAEACDIARGRGFRLGFAWGVVAGAALAVALFLGG